MKRFILNYSKKGINRLPVDIRKKFNTSKNKNHKQILNKIGRTGRFVGITLFMYYLLKKIGINLSLNQSLVAFIAAASIAVSSVGFVTYYSVKKYYQTNGNSEIQQNINQETVPVSNDTPETDTKTIAKNVSSDPGKKTAITPLKVSSVTGDPEAKKLVSASISNELSNIRTLAKTTSNDSLNIICNVIKTDIGYSITLKAIDQSTGKIHFVSSEDAVSSNLKSATRKLTREMSDSIE